MIEVLIDDFGPSIYRPTDALPIGWQLLIEDPNLPFYKYHTIREDRGWLNQALYNLDQTFESLGIVDSDFDDPDDEWQPIPLDRDNPSLQAAIQSLDETIKLVRADNGYNANVPEERNYVLSNLESASEKLKKASETSVPYIRRFIAEPLALIMRRFKDAAIAIAAMAAREAIVEYLKQAGIRFLDSIFRQ